MGLEAMHRAFTDEAPTLAIDVGASHTRLALVSNGSIARRTAMDTAALAAHERGVAGGLVPAITAFLEGSGPTTPSRPIAAGIGIAATIDGAGNVIEARDFGVPAGPVVRDALASGLRVPVVVENDANLAALAERRYGAARGRDHVAVLTLGTNIGLGLILGGRLYRGARGAAGEAGLLLVAAGDATARSTRVSGGRRTVDAGRFGIGTSAAPDGYAWIEELVGGAALASAAGGQHVMRAASTDATAHAAVDRAIEGWALVIADLSVVLDPEVVVLVGEMAVDAAPLLPRLQRRVAELVALPPEVCLGTVGPDAQLLGADLLARAAVARGATNHARAGLSAQSVGGQR